LARLRGEIYFGAEYLILDFRLYLCFFKNAGYMEKGYKKAYEKEDLADIPCGCFYF
jgi:hypothetical protein